MSDELRNSLWNLLDIYIWQSDGFLYSRHRKPGIDNFSASLWFSYLKQPIDARPDRSPRILEAIRQYFFAAIWHEVYDFLEWTLNEVRRSQLNDAVTPRASIGVLTCFSPMSAARTSDGHATGETAGQVSDGPATPFIVVGGRTSTMISTRFA